MVPSYPPYPASHPQAICGPKPTTPVISPSNKDRSSLSPGSEKDNNGQSLHKRPSSANIAANTEVFTNTIKGFLCAPSTYINTAHPPGPKEDAFSSNSND